MAHNHEPHPPLVAESAMDYSQHEATYNNFISLLKYGIFSIVLLVLGLYAAVIAGQAILGVLLVIASVVVPPLMAAMAKK